MNDMIPGSEKLWMILAFIAVGIVTACFAPVGALEMSDYYAVHPNEFGPDMLFIGLGLVVMIIAAIMYQLGRR